MTSSVRSLSWRRQSHEVMRSVTSVAPSAKSWLMSSMTCATVPAAVQRAHANTPPPSTTTVCPVTKPLAGLASHSTVPTRSSGVIGLGRQRSLALSDR